MRRNRKTGKDKQQQFEDWHQETLKKYGWLAHFVLDDTNTPNNTNYHTHGLAEQFGHPDLQICLPLRPEIAHSVMTKIINKIKEGKRFEPGIEYDGLLAGGYKLQFIAAEEGDRKVLRVVFPNTEGNYKGAMYKAQFTKLSNRPAQQKSLRKTASIKRKRK